MSTLRDFITSSPVSSNYKQSQLAIWKTNNYDAQNGGQCCCWIVPGATSWAIFEVWGGGGDGEGGVDGVVMGCVLIAGVNSPFGEVATPFTM